MIGENSIKFELHNSHIPMFVLHDLYLEFNGLSTQIDYLIITRKHQFVIECKNLYGNIEVNSSGDFIRTINMRRYKKKEGIYSPITQNQRHLDLIKQIRSDAKSNFISRALFEGDFYNNYRSIVVLANPKTILNARYAKKEIKSQVIRADQLAAYIKKIDADPKSTECSEKDMKSLAHFFLETHKQKEMDYTEKYWAEIEALSVNDNIETCDKESEPVENENMICVKCGAPMVL